ncbi:MAG: S-layer homology domain-containing protein [Ruminococcaceae bacterium]|nr:S-layer homology domain-containing protein [Oscillospiraceae bacterium]
MKTYGVKILTLALCFLMLSGISGFAATSNETEIAELLAKLSIMNGYPDGELRLEQAVTRAEFSKVTIVASPYKNQVASSMAVSPFSDVNYSHWAAPYVKLAVSKGLVTGYPDSTFRPDRTVLLEEAVTIYLKLLGYTNDDFGYSWPYGQVGLGRNIGLLDNISAETGSELSRRDVMRLTYNLLTCSPKGSTADYLESIQYKLAEDVVLIATNAEDSAVNPGRVATSVGTYKIDEGFNHDHIGMRGDVVLKNGDTLVCFIPYEQSVEEYVVYSRLDAAIVTYQNGSMSRLDLEDGTTAYVGTQATTYASAKQNLEMGDVVSVVRDEGGSVEYITIRSGKVTGPVVVRDKNWHQALSVSEDITVMRDGVKCTADAIQIYDVVYYSPDLNMVLSYSKRVTGIYESASPNKDQLTQVTISGVTYGIESAEAFQALSSSGSIQYGDTVTVLLGKDGDIAGVVTAGEKSSVVGFFSTAGVKNYETATGESYSNYYVEIIGTDGSSFQYAAKRDYSDSTALNQVVRVTFSNGLASVSSYNKTGISGRVDASARLLGNVPFADVVHILDVVETSSTEIGSYAPAFLQQLDRMHIGESNILYYETNAKGEITDLILNDMTGECYAYGIVTKAVTSNVGMHVSGSYTYDIAGVSGIFSAGSTSYPVSGGQPVMLRMAGGRVQSLKALSKLSANIIGVTDSTLKSSTGQSYRLSDDVAIYHKRSYDYTIIPLSELQSGSYKITAYHDKDINSGGRIRVVVAELK